jgi:hypothetical protein
MLSAASSREIRSAILIWTYDGGKIGKHEIQFAIVPLAGT